MSQLVIVGTIGRPHGLRGEVMVRPRTDRVEERFAVGSTLTLNEGTLTVTSSSAGQARLVVGFAGITDRTGAEALRGLDLWAAADAEELSSEEYHDTALMGLVAVDPAGAILGEVVEVQHNPAHDLLVVRTEIGDRLVPFVSELVPQVDLEAGRLVINPIPGLLSEVPDAD